MADPFRFFIFTSPDKHRGWGCGIKPDTDPRTALAAATELACRALFLINDPMANDEEEDDSWFHKVDILLHAVTLNEHIEQALIAARILESGLPEQPARINFLELNASSWHEWTRKLLDRFCGGSLTTNPSIDEIESHLKIESVRAQSILGNKRRVKKPRTPSRPMKERDLVFKEWNSQGMAPKQIAAKWNAENKDDVTYDAVTKALQRIKMDN